MRAKDDKLSAARAVANSGTDYLSTGTLTYATQWPINTSKGWYAFVVLEACTVSAVTLVDSQGNTLTPANNTWSGVELPAGMYVSAGFVGGKDAYISAITIAGKIALYLD